MGIIGRWVRFKGRGNGLIITSYSGIIGGLFQFPFRIKSVIDELVDQNIQILLQQNITRRMFLEINRQDNLYPAKPTPLRNNSHIISKLYFDDVAYGLLTALNIPPKLLQINPFILDRQT